VLHQKPSKGPHTLRPPARPPLNITLRQRVRRIYLPPLFGEHLGVCGRISWSCALSRPCAASVWSVLNLGPERHHGPRKRLIS